MSLCDPDPGTSYRRDSDVTAATLQNVDELAGVGDVRLLPGETGSSRRPDNKPLRQNKKCSVFKRKRQRRWTEGGEE